MSQSSERDWQDLAMRLHEKGGVPERRAQVVALIVAGRTHSEVQEKLELTRRSEVAKHVKYYRERSLPHARWLAEHGPDI